MYRSSVGKSTAQLSELPTAFIHFELTPHHLLIAEGGLYLFDFEQATIGPVEFEDDGQGPMHRIDYGGQGHQPAVLTRLDFEDAIEAMRPFLANADVLLLGCGLGQSDAALAFVKSLVRGTARLPSLILDADALNLLAKVPNWWQKLPGDAILTPHPGEMSRLTGLSIEEVQSRRLGVARDSAMSWQKTIVLKGACTIIASPDGQASVNPAINPGLASGRTGDVLAGAIAGLVAQGLSLRDAAVAGVFLHSQAGEMAGNEMGNAGMLASDLLPLLLFVMINIKEGSFACAELN